MLEASKDSIPTKIFDKLPLTEFIPSSNIDSYSSNNDVISGSSLSNDYNISFNKHLDVDASFAPVLHVKLKLNKISTLEVFFTTSEFTEFCQTNSARIGVNNPNKFEDFYIPLYKNKNWHGKITGLRIDPASAPSSFELSLVEFLDFNRDDCFRIIINRDELKNLDFQPELDEKGNVMVTIDPPVTGILSRLMLYHEYSRFTGYFMLASKTDEITMYENSDMAILNSKRIQMPFTYTTRDGLPYVALDFIAKALNLDSELTDYSLTINSKH